MSNKNVPRTFGDSVIHESHIDIMVENNDFPLYERHLDGPRNPAEKKIGELIGNNLVEDGATLQMGIGAIPDACLGSLKHHMDLGVHTECFSDGILELMECSAITNARKPLFPGKVCIVTFIAFI